MSASADAARWTPGSPAWVTHQQLQTENCELRNDRDRLRAALAALEQEMRDDASWAKEQNLCRFGDDVRQWADRLAALLQERP